MKKIEIEIPEGKCAQWIDGILTLVDEPKNIMERVKTFEDACEVLNTNPNAVYLIFDGYLQDIYKLKIINKALNGVEWEPNLNTGTIYYPWVRYYPKGSSYNSNWTHVANFKAKEDNKVYTLVSGDYGCCGGGLGNLGCGYGGVGADRGLLGCKSKEIAKYFGKTFGKLIFDAIYGHYNNYTWV